LRILIAEDNPINMMVLERTLEDMDCQCVSTYNGRELLDQFERGTFDVVLMDVQMPEMGGFEATGAIRAQERSTGTHLPIVAMTAHAMKGDRERCLAAGMDEYVTKPLDPRGLCAIVELAAATDYSNRAVTVPAPANPHVAGAADSQRDASRTSGADSATVPPLDLSDQVLARVGGDRQLLAEISKLFVDDAPMHLERIRAALDARDGEALRRAAHGLKGAAANFDAEGVVAASRVLEEMGRTSTFDLGDEAWRSLERETTRLIGMLGRVVASV
jgi:two-component system sensor histidine kinase/response regulator